MIAMTHSELTESTGFASDCAGELAHEGDCDDQVVAAEGTFTRVVSLWICRGCGYFLSTSGAVVLNAYAPPPKRVLAAVKGGE
jgi:hypothetical protein